ncbi:MULTISPECIES: hypothetical protein, partial [unclassified Cedecea]|uniref:hypothetical protein n=1 Tax=unclassified Cedecea TaxID=2649846 RepID=UPI0030162BAC
TDDLFVGKTLLHGNVLMWLMKTLLTSRCINQWGAGQSNLFLRLARQSEFPLMHCVTESTMLNAVTAMTNILILSFQRKPGLLVRMFVGCELHVSPRFELMLQEGKPYQVCNLLQGS